MSIVFEMLKYTNPPFPPGVLAMKTPHPRGIPRGPISPSPGVQTLAYLNISKICLALELKIKQSRLKKKQRIIFTQLSLRTFI